MAGWVRAWVVGVVGTLAALVDARPASAAPGAWQAAALEGVQPTASTPLSLAGVPLHPVSSDGGNPFERGSALLERHLRLRLPMMELSLRRAVRTAMLGYLMSSLRRLNGPHPSAPPTRTLTVAAARDALFLAPGRGEPQRLELDTWQWVVAGGSLVTLVLGIGLFLWDDLMAMASVEPAGHAGPAVTGVKVRVFGAHPVISIRGRW